MELGDRSTEERDKSRPLDQALDAFESALAELITTVETSALDHLKNEEKVAVWQRFENIREPTAPS